MRKTLFVSGLAMLCLLTACQNIQSKNSQQKDKLIRYNPLETKGIHEIKIDTSNPLIVVKDGKSNVEIVVHKASSPVVRYAAEELRKRLVQATNADIKIVAKRTGAIPAIILGDNKWIRALGIDVNKLPRDGFVIKRVVDTIVIAGKDDPYIVPAKMIRRGYWAQMYQRATLFGVYSFLEQFVGIRYYFPGEMGTVIPKQKTLSVPAMDIIEAPDLIQRAVSWYHGQGFKKGNRKDDFERGNLELYRLRGQTRHIPNCHGLSRVGLSERFAESHPEYFALLKNGKRDNDMSLPGHRGHLCYMNKSLQNEVYKDAAAFLTEKPASYRQVRHKYGCSWDNSGFQPGFFNVMPQDGLGVDQYCQCPLCIPYTHHDKVGEMIWQFVSDIASKVKKNGIPGYITSMAYGICKTVPKVDLPDNVLIMLALSGPWMEQNPDVQKMQDQYIVDWNKKVAPYKVWLWNYANKYGARNIPGIPNSTPRAVGSYYKRNGKIISGASMESETDVFLFNYLNWYVFSKVCWDTNTDVDALLNEHNEKMFGSGAKPMGEFFNIIEDLWLNKCLGKTVDTPLGPKNYPPQEQEMWENIYSDAMMVRLSNLFVKARKLASNEPECLKRINFMEKNFFGPVKAARKAYFARKREIEDLVLEAIPVNGRPDENAWKNAPVVTMVPLKNSEKALVKTTVKALWNDKSLFLKFNCQEPKTDRLSYIKRQEDDKNIWCDASVEIFLNPSGDRKNYYQIIVNPAGNVSDVMLTTNKNGKKILDWDWDAGVKVETDITKTGWTANIEIPFASLTGKPIKSGTSFVANFCRSRNLKNVKRQENQLYTWSPYVTHNFHQIGKFGSIKFVKKKGISNQLLLNGDFSKLNKNGTLLGWYLPKGDARKHVSLDTGYFRTGGRSLKLENAKKSICAMQLLPNLKPNKTYLLTFFVKTENIVPQTAGKGAGGACINLWTSKNEWFPKNWYRGSIPWTKQGFIIKTDSQVNKKHKSYIRLRLDKANGSVWFDDVRLREMILP